MILEYIVKENESKTTINNILKNHLFLSRTQIRRAKSNNTIFLNGECSRVKSIVNTNDCVSVKIIEHRVSNEIISTNIPLDILYEDEYIIAINKPKNMLCHPVGSDVDNTLANALKYYYEQKDIFMVIRPISRLDRNTTGVILFAKNSYVHSLMVNVMRQSTSYKKYLAITNSIPNISQGLIDFSIKRKEGSIIERVIADDGQICKTKYKVIEKHVDSALIEFELLTGRTHQIRVHCKAFGIPITGDTLYNIKSPYIDRQALHSYEIFFIHPFTKEEVLIKSELPSDMLFLISKLSKSL